MGTYGLRDDETDDEVTTEGVSPTQGQQQGTVPVGSGNQLQLNRKRPFPAAFSVEEPAEIYPYTPAAPQSQGYWGSTSQIVMDCFKTVFTWVTATTILYGEKLFQKGIC